MSDSPGTVAKSESGRVLPRRIFDDILALANSLLEDECPIADFEDWLFPIDDTLLELKLWAKTAGVEQGLLERVVRYDDLCFVVGQILCDVKTPLQDIEKLCENPEILTSAEVQATVSTAIDQFQSSTSILMDTVESTLIDTVELFQECSANAKEQSLLHIDKPIGSITDSPYEVNTRNRRLPTCDKIAEGQQKMLKETKRAGLITEGTLHRQSPDLPVAVATLDSTSKTIMTKGSQQGFRDLAMPDPATSNVHKPEIRADTDRKKSAKKPLRERKWPNLKKLRKKNAQGNPQYNVTIVSARYDNERHKWMYTLNDWQDVRIAGETEEKDLV